MEPSLRKSKQQLFDVERARSDWLAGSITDAPSMPRPWAVVERQNRGYRWFPRALKEMQALFSVVAHSATSQVHRCVDGDWTVAFGTTSLFFRPRLIWSCCLVDKVAVGRVFIDSYLGPSMASLARHAIL